MKIPTQLCFIIYIFIKLTNGLTIRPIKTIYSNLNNVNSEELIFTNERVTSNQNLNNKDKPVLITKKLPQAIIIGAKKCGKYKQ